MLIGVYAEDSEINQSFVLKMLESYSDELRLVDVVPSGEQLLQKLLDKSYDFALIDFKMPEIHGVELIQKIECSYPNLKLIILSSLDPRPAFSDLRNSLHLYLEKPLDKEKINLIISYLNTGENNGNQET